MTQAKRKVLICGASGFIGINLFEHLSKREDLDVYGTYLTEKISDSPRLIKADLTRREEVNAIIKGYDIVIQAAANTSSAKDVIEKPYLHVTDNAVMNALMYQAAFDQSIPQLIFFSCTTMYPASMDRPIRETDLDLNDGIYDKYFGVAWTKLYIEKLCEFYSRLGRNQYTVLRHSNIYGPYDRFNLDKAHVCAATIAKVMEAKDKIVVWGEGKEVRDLVYVSDLVDCVEKIIDSKDKAPFKLLNIGCGEGISVEALVKKIIKISEKNLAIEYDTSKPNIPTKVVIDYSKAREILGWTPRVSLDEGLRKTIAWYKENIKA